MGGTISLGGKGSDKELADQLDAEDRLLNRGYKKRRCSACDGVGIIIEAGRVSPTCGSCDGRGVYWESPLTKQGLIPVKE